jgi:hypothetical protein
VRQGTIITAAVPNFGPGDWKSASQVLVVLPPLPVKLHPAPWYQLQGRRIRGPKNPLHVCSILTHPHMHATCSL